MTTVFTDAQLKFYVTHTFYHDEEGRRDRTPWLTMAEQLYEQEDWTTLLQLARIFPLQAFGGNLVYGGAVDQLKKFPDETWDWQALYATAVKTHANRIRHLQSISPEPPKNFQKFFEVVFSEYGGPSDPAEVLAYLLEQKMDKDSIFWEGWCLLALAMKSRKPEQPEKCFWLLHDASEGRAASGNAKYMPDPSKVTAAFADRLRKAA